MKPRQPGERYRPRRCRPDDHASEEERSEQRTQKAYREREHVTARFREVRPPRAAGRSEAERLGPPLHLADARVGGRRDILA